MVVQATKLILPRSSLSPRQVSSLLFEPHSLSLALMHPDSSFSLLPCLSPLSVPPPPPPLPTFISPPSSAASFLLVRSQNPNHNGNPRVLFFVAGPLEGGVSTLLRFWILNEQARVFSKARVMCSQSNLRSEDGLGVVLKARHGVSIKLSGSTNYFALYSCSDLKIWIFAVKTAGEHDDGDGVFFKLMKCAVVECSLPVWSITLSFGLMILGEENGVRVLPLRPLVKGWVKKPRPESKSSRSDRENVKGAGVPKLPNGVVQVTGETNVLRLNYIPGGDRGCSEKKGDSAGFSVKFRTLKLGQNLRQGNSYFVAFKRKEVGSSNFAASPISERAISIQALSVNKYLVLDSVGNLHFFCLSNPTSQPEPTFQMIQLAHSIKVRKLAAFADSSTKNQTIWVSDGLYSVHIMTLSDSEISNSETETSESNEGQMLTSVSQMIFASERIQDIIPLAADAIMILGHGDISVYALS